jgi:hypothetical protein
MFPVSPVQDYTSIQVLDTANLTVCCEWERKKLQDYVRREKIHSQSAVVSSSREYDLEEEGKKWSTPLWVPSVERVVYDESIKRELKVKPISECRCDERLKTKVEESTPLA